jgi:Flp pilus assembly protein TadD
MVAWIIALGVLTWDQVRVWRSTESLWTHAALAEPECSICENNVGSMLVNSGNSRAALIHFAQTITLRPDREKVYGGIGLALIQLGRVADAEPYLERALAKDGFDVGVLNNMGIALVRQGKFEQAIPYLRRALVQDPVNLRALCNLGAALAGSGHLEAGLKQFERAAQVDAFAEEPRIGLIQAYLQQGNIAEARKHYTILRQLHPKAPMTVALAHRFAS